MDMTDQCVPHGRIGYLVDDMERFLRGADERADDLRRQLAEARRRVTEANARAAAAADLRLRIAERWLEAQAEAEALRHEATASTNAAAS